MHNLGPEFIDVRCKADGSTIDLTLELAKSFNIQNIVALSGDPPLDQSLHPPLVPTAFPHAIDLIHYVHQTQQDDFCIGVAGYPEGHPGNPDVEDDFQHFIEKCGSGVQRLTAFAKTHVPQSILDDLEPIKVRFNHCFECYTGIRNVILGQDDDQAVKDYGVQLAIDMCKKLKDGGIRGFHFYCMNLEKSVRLILEGLGFVAPIDVVRPLPWNPSLDKKREKETVRPIYWRNRTRSYILRTEGWDDFPNGRWGDSRSPAYGDLDSYGVSLKTTSEESLSLWGSPTTLQELYDIFSKFCENKITSLPWCSQPLAPESEPIRANLIDVNARGYLTINSQPAVDGVPSSDKSVGWGPRNGYVYQKAYLEFFVSPESVDILIERIQQSFPIMTYYAVNKQGDLKTNATSDGPVALTWGVFPGKEILQPTVVDPVSFMAWKDEAFGIWESWGEVFKNGCRSRALITDILERWFLMNVIDNDYKRPNGIFEIFNA
ncbi:hypothetical protein HDU67_002509 [Dinochytrium kinnereticum]|nr:hypothetical protein HDU67_002509 [Dinochytrium kinnereticum]